MVWTLQDSALVAAGVIGAGVALIHGWLTQRHLVRPAGGAPTVQRLNGALLHFSTYSWFVGGLALAAAPLLGREGRLATCLLVGLAYLYAVIGNAWATRGRHLGWMLYALALILIMIGANPGAPA